MSPKFALLTLIVLFGLSATMLRGQDKLYLENPGRMKRIELVPGDTLLFSAKNDEFRYGARFRGAKADWVYFREDSIKVTEIDALWTRPQPGARYWVGMLQGAAIMAAIVYPAMILLNRTAVTGYESKDMVEMGIVAGSAITLYFLLKVFRWQKRNLEKGNWKLKIRTPVERLF
jgi:hypothetical protein